MKRLGIAAGLVLATVLAVRAVDAWRAPPLKLWHTEVPHELKAGEIDRADWSTWLKAEDAVFAEVRRRVTDKLPAEDRIAANRFFESSPMNPLRLVTDWNRTQVLEPLGKPRGAVVLLHGLTDSPYSLRHIAAHYRDRGFVAVTIRMPGHGTVPAGLTQVDWEDWMAATRMAVLHARVLAGETTPLHIVGYSNGGALALKYTLDTLENPTLARPDQVVLISPMIGITSFARFAGVLGWPAVFPPFAKAAWLDVVPEYNPIKYNSFPVNAARQSSQLVRNLDAQFTRLWSQGALKELPPILAFQSVVDSTVLVPALFGNLYSRIPNNGSAIVLFDRNWSADASALVRPEKANVTADIVPPGPRRYTVTVVQNSASSAVPMSMTVAAEGNLLTEAPLAGSYPAHFYSLSHVALSFPLGDPLYGIAPDPAENMGVRLGTVAVRGERGVLIVGSDTLMRATCNPFFDYLLERIDATLTASPP